MHEKLKKVLEILSQKVICILQLKYILKVIDSTLDLNHVDPDLEC